jgi:ankyrin repeat protein
MPEFPEEKNDLLIEYVKKGATGGALMALQAGADANHKDSSWGSATALHYAAIYGGHEALALLGAGANINAATSVGRTPLHDTALYNNPEVAKVLLANGAQVNVRDEFGRTALYYARRDGHPEMEALLLQHGCFSASLMPPQTRTFQRMLPWWMWG